MNPSRYVSTDHAPFPSLPRRRVEEELPSLSRLSKSLLDLKNSDLILSRSATSLDDPIPLPVPIAHRFECIQLARLPVHQRGGKQESGLG